jgi:hypothetical protein
MSSEALSFSDLSWPDWLLPWIDRRSDWFGYKFKGHGPDIRQALVLRALTMDLSTMNEGVVKKTLQNEAYSYLRTVRIVKVPHRKLDMEIKVCDLDDELLGTDHEAFCDSLESLVAELPARLRSVAMFLACGMSVAEIAVQQDCGLTVIYEKIRELKTVWRSGYARRVVC